MNRFVPEVRRSMVSTLVGLLGALVMLGACTSFDALERDVCGNGLIEAGEDCDSGDASCVRCAVVCAASTDCPSADYACGVDGVCHAPGGALAQPVVAGTFQVHDYRITDVDHDGTGDVLGLSTTSIVVRHGDASGSLASSASLVTPATAGAAAFGDLDLDGSLDLALPTADGLVAYTSRFGTLSPLAVQSDIVGAEGEALDLRMVFQIGPLTVGGFVVDPVTGSVAILALDFLDADSAVVALPCAGRVGAIPVAAFSPDRVDVYVASREGDLSTDLVVAMSAGSGASATFCVMSIHKELIGPASIVDITPATAGTPARRPVLADLDTDLDRCPGLVDTDGGAAALRYWDGALAAGRCTLVPSSEPAGDPLPAIAAASPTAVVIDRIPLEPMIPFASSDALVLTDGVYAHVPLGATTFPVFYRSTRPLRRAVSRDLDHDGDVDAVLVADGEDDLDVLYRSTSPQGFQLLRLDTAAQVATITLGDYDGNGVEDIAYAEQLAGFQRLMVSYGTADQPLPPILVGAVTSTVSMTRVALQTSSDLLSLADDLIVLQPPASGELATLSVLFGSTQRTLLPYFDPRPEAERGGTIFRAAVIGELVASGGATEYPDVLGIAPPALASGSSSVRAWRVPGTGTGLDGTPTEGAAVPGLAPCGTGAGQASGQGVCVADAAYLTWPGAPGASTSTVIAIDRAPRPHAAAVGADGAAMPLSALASQIPEGSEVRSLFAAELAGDGAPELVAVFAPRAEGRGAVLVCSMTAGRPEACEDVVPAILAIAPGTTACLDAAPARIGYRDRLSTSGGTARDLVVLCRDEGRTLYRLHDGGAGFVADVLRHTTSALDTVRAGDVTGDGIDDVVALEGERGSRSLVVFPQCSSRELAACPRGEPGGAP